MKFLFILFALFSKIGTKTTFSISGIVLVDYFNAQTYTSGGNVAFNSWSVYQTNSPTNTYGNRYNCVNINRDSIVLRTKYIMMDSISGYNFSMVPGAKFAWLDGRQMKLSYMDSLPLSYSQVTTALGFIPSLQVNSDWNSVSGASQILNKPTLFSGAYSDLTGKPSLFSGVFTDLISKPTTLSGYGITDSQAKLNGTGFVKVSGTTVSYDNNTYLTSEVDGSISNEIQTLSINNNTLSISGGNSINLPVATFTAISAGTGISIGSNSIVTNTLPDQVVTLTAGNNDISITGTYPNFVITPYVPVTYTVTRAINSSTFQISTTRHADAIYNIGISCTASIGGNASGLVQLQYSIDGGVTWINASRIKNSNTVTLAIVLQSVNEQEVVLVVQNIPANSRLKFVPTQSGTTTITSILGFETY